MPRKSRDVLRLMKYHPLPWRLSKGYKTVAVMDASDKIVTGSLLMPAKPGDEETYAFIVGAAYLAHGLTAQGEGAAAIFQKGREPQRRS